MGVRVRVWGGKGVGGRLLEGRVWRCGGGDEGYRGWVLGVRVRVYEGVRVPVQSTLRSVVSKPPE